ncbi:MAG: hypothetical protein BGO90_09975 [Legionella sp. 40-6]|nr:hypothetical protein [Legionella sp.]OJY10869.1 MAG: hypothetical protein BGO90_09975 [Legionella sp. 40-6]
MPIFTPEELSDLTLPKIEHMFQRINPSCFKIDFSKAHNFGQNPQHWANIFQLLPKRMFTIMFGGKQLCGCPQENLLIIFTALPKNIKCIEFNYCSLYKMSEEARNFLLELCTKKLQSLSLADNKLYRLVRFDQLAQSLSKQLLSLDLSGNYLTHNQIVEFLTHVKAPLRHLNLQGNHPAETENELINLMQVLPDTVYSLSLEAPWTMSLKESFNRLRHIVYLNLDGSALFYKETPILADEFSELPPALRYLQLTNNALHLKLPQELEFILARIPSSVKTILLDQSKLSLAQLAVLRNDNRVRFEKKSINAYFALFAAASRPSIENNLPTAKL